MNAFPAILAGTSIVLVLTDGSELTGTYKGTNSKGVRIVLDGTTKETTRALSKIESVRDAGTPALSDDAPLVAEVTVVAETDTYVVNVPTDAELKADSDAALEAAMLADFGLDAEVTVTDVVGNAVTAMIDQDAPERIHFDTDEDETPEVSLDNADLEAIQAAIGAGDDEGFTSGELAAIFGDSAYNLRKVFRSLGMGVGKGSRYFLHPVDVKKVYDHLNG